MPHDDTAAPADGLRCPLCGGALVPTPGDPDLLSCPSCGLAALHLLDAGDDDADPYAPPWAGWQEALEEDMRRGERGLGNKNKRRRRGGKRPEAVPWYRRPSSYWD